MRYHQMLVSSSRVRDLNTQSVSNADTWERKAPLLYPHTYTREREMVGCWPSICQVSHICGILPAHGRQQTPFSKHTVDAFEWLEPQRITGALTGCISQEQGGHHQVATVLKRVSLARTWSRKNEDSNQAKTIFSVSGTSLRLATNAI